MLFSVVLIVGLPLVLWRGPWWFDGKYLRSDDLRTGSANLVIGFRAAVVQSVVAIGASIALLSTARSYRLSVRGQATDRFTKALERLGSDQLCIRVGGIFALEQIVQEVPEQATHAARVLNAFVLDRAPRRRVKSNTSAVIAARRAARGRSAQRESSMLPDAPAEDVMAALRALTRPSSRRLVDSTEIIDLRGCHLAGAWLDGMDLTDAWLDGADLTGAQLGYVKLTRARLCEADLTDAQLKGANLVQAQLSENETRPWWATSPPETLHTRLRAAGYRFDTRGDLLIGSWLNPAKLAGALLANADLTNAKLAGVDFSNARLSWTNFTGAQLQGADFTNASLFGIGFTNAQLRGVDFTNTEATADVIRAAEASDDTEFDGFL
ncbi:pentapeptide repeat-containing protein [Streptomyces cacaoi]